MKNDRIHLPHKVEYAVDMDTSAVVAVTVHGGCDADSQSLEAKIEEAVENLGDMMRKAEATDQVSATRFAELPSDKRYRDNAVVKACQKTGAHFNLGLFMRELFGKSRTLQGRTLSYRPGNKKSIRWWNRLLQLDARGFSEILDPSVKASFPQVNL